jgi:hypothetical protein
VNVFCDNAHDDASNATSNQIKTRFIDDVKEGEMAGKTDVSQYTRRCAILGFAFD